MLSEMPKKKNQSSKTHRRKRRAKVTNNSLLDFREVTTEAHRDVCLFLPECVSKRRGGEPAKLTKPPGVQRTCSGDDVIVKLSKLEVMLTFITSY